MPCSFCGRLVHIYVHNIPQATYACIPCVVKAIYAALWDRIK